MSVNWKKTNTPGVRYYEHKKRKHGVNKDRYFTIRYRLNGKVKEEALGWWSEGWTEDKAAAQLHQLKENRRRGDGETTLADKRKVAMEKAKREKEVKAKIEKDLITFSAIFDQYFKQSLLDKKRETCVREQSIFNKWLAPLLGSLPMKNISPFILEKLKKQMADAKKAPRTITYTLAVIRQAFNYAKNHDLYFGDNPTVKVKKPSQDNRRVRFLSYEESKLLLEELSKIKTPTTHDMALLSLHCGLRAGEIFNLSWSDVDFQNETILIKDTKSGRNRNAVMTAGIKEMLERRRLHPKADIVFPSRNGDKIVEISRAFDRTIDNLAFNKNISDIRQKVVFHTLRHTYASWLVMSGVDLYTVQKLMGHSTISMTERYSHLAPDHLKKAVSMLEDSMNRHKASALVNFKEIAKA